MAYDKLKMAYKFLPFLLSYGLRMLGQRLYASIHYRTYTALPRSFSRQKTVLVVGGSFAGNMLVRRLTETLPSGWKVILVEKNSHLNYLFTFPRFSVIKGYEELAFIPYDGLAKFGPSGIFERKQGLVTDITENQVVLNNGETVGYDYLVIATGTSSPLPNKVVSTEKEGGCAELRAIQAKIQKAKRIAIVGGGAVGVEIASDIKDFNPDKEVTIVHSRDRLLNSFGARLSEFTLKRFAELGITTVLGERPMVSGGNGETLTFGDGKQETYDLVIPCTGQRPNSGIIANLSPSSISKQTSRILVTPTLQLHDKVYPNIFALGDVAETGGPKMARASFFQCEIVLANLLSLIQHDGKGVLRDYVPYVAMEGAIKLTLGKKDYVMYSQDDKGDDILLPNKNGQIDLEIGKGWKMFTGQSMKQSGWQPPALDGI